MGALGKVGAEVLKPLIIPPFLPLLKVHAHLVGRGDVRVKFNAP